LNLNLNGNINKSNGTPSKKSKGALSSRSENRFEQYREESND